MLSFAPLAATTFAPVTTPGVAVAPRASTVRMESIGELKALATKLNPILGYWDPMNLAEYDQFSAGQDAQIGFLRQAEIKHGRVAMAAFVGFIVQSNGVHFPWALTREGVSFADISAAGGPCDQWDALPTAAKVQILLAVGFLESVSESSYILGLDGEKHYMAGGKPGYFPSIKGVFPHPVPLDLWDPFGFTKNMTPEKKAKGLLAEINNGRMAMLGSMAFVAEASVPGSVPALGGKIAPYSGEVMAPFAAGDASLPFVADMVTYKLPF